MREFTIFAPAKLNLYLDVLGKRPDGYHNIKTLFEKIGLRDEILIREKEKGLDVKVEPPITASGKDNIVYKALQALFKEAKLELGFEIIIKKKIPVSAGLGGGSSDAATVLRAVNKEFNLGISSERLFSIACETGKDVPFFMLDAPFALATGAGESLEPVDIENSFSHIVLKPDISISTASMYKRIEDRGYAARDNGIKEMVSALQKQDLALLQKKYYNIFEQVLAEYSQHIEKARSLFRDIGAGPGFLSGSGPSVFCILKDREEAMSLLKKMPREKGMDIFLATTYKGGIYGDY